MSEQLPTTSRERIIVTDAEEVLFDTGRFEQLQRVAQIMCTCKTVPDFLHDNFGDAFRVAEQAMRWQLSPFAIADKTFLVGGKLAYEGQLIAAVVNLRAGLDGRLSYQFKGDRKEPKTLSVVVSGRFRNEAEERTVEVDWATGQAMAKGAKDQWLRSPEQQLSYFAARVWARRHCPEIILGAYTPEELYEDTAVEPAIKDVTPPKSKLDRLEQAIAAERRVEPTPVVTTKIEEAEKQIAADNEPELFPENANQVQVIEIPMANGGKYRDWRAYNEALASHLRECTSVAEVEEIVRANHAALAAMKESASAIWNEINAVITKRRRYLDDVAHGRI